MEVRCSTSSMNSKTMSIRPHVLDGQHTGIAGSDFRLAEDFAGTTSITCSSSSSSISVPVVPLDVTGDGPTISLGLVTSMFGAFWIMFCWKEVASAELRAELLKISL